ncbi:MAG: DUF485 domain-containing protein [Myxococcales bacterium]|nr:DUF485 domain-containing protein [Myxococcales bacterium]
MSTQASLTVAQSLAVPNPDPHVADEPLPAELAELAQLSARRGRLAAALTTIMMIGYFGFILLVAFAKPTAGTLLAGDRVSVGIVAGACVIVLAPILTAIYVRWANQHYDAAVRRLRGGKA